MQIKAAFRALLRFETDYAAGSGGNDEGISHSIGVSSPNIRAAKLNLKEEGL